MVAFERDGHGNWADGNAEFIGLHSDPHGDAGGEGSFEQFVRAEPGAEPALNRQDISIGLLSAIRKLDEVTWFFTLSGDHLVARLKELESKSRSKFKSKKPVLLSKEESVASVGHVAEFRFGCLTRAHRIIGKGREAAIGSEQHAVFAK